MALSLNWGDETGIDRRRIQGIIILIIASSDNEEQKQLRLICFYLQTKELLFPTVAFIKEYCLSTHKRSLALKMGADGGKKIFQEYWDRCKELQRNLHQAYDAAKIGNLGIKAIS